MKQNGYLVTRSELDEMFLKRPAYSLASVGSGVHPVPSVFKANYFATCTKVDGSSPNMPYYEELSPIRIARFTFKNYADDYRNVRLGYKVPNGTMQYTDWQTINEGQTGTVVVEGLDANTQYLFYPEANVTEDFYLFEGGIYNATTSSGGYFSLTPIDSGQLENTNEYMVMAGSVKVELRCIVETGQAMNITIIAGDQSYNAGVSSLDYTFLIPWNNVFSVEAMVGEGGNGTYTFYLVPEMYDVTPLSPYNAQTGVFDGYINLELSTGTDPNETYYELHLYHEYQ